MDTVYEIDDIQIRLSPIFRAKGVKSAVLYGSYAMGLANQESDVDILVDSDLHGLGFVGLIEAIREKLDKEVDVIDVRYVKKGSQVEKEILKYGVRIYG